MTLSIIGAGFGRTGTTSLKLALEKIGRGPCYHMMEVFQNPAHIDLWNQAADGRPNWDTVFDGYASAVDWPASAFYQQLLDQYPDARVILTARDSDKWYQSVSDTIYASSIRPLRDTDPPFLPAHRAMAQTVVWDGIFGGRFDDKAHAIATYERHNAKVQEQVPSDRLLVFEPGEGWAPLCAFLGCDVPSEPFPRANTTEEFRGRFL